MERQFHRRHPWHRGNIPDIPESKFAFILQMKNDVLTEFRSRVKALEFRDLKFTTITNLRHHVHLKSAENDAPIKFVFRIAISGKSASAEKLNRVQQLFDEIISQECFQSCRDIIVHIK